MRPDSALATFPAKTVSACLGIRYWAKTEKNSLNTLGTGGKNRADYNRAALRSLVLMRFPAELDSSLRFFELFPDRLAGSAHQMRLKFDLN